MKTWKAVSGYEGLYSVSDCGEIRSDRSGKLRAIQTQKNGYLAISLNKDSHEKRLYVHRIVATAFIENSENKPTVNHINGNKADNHVINLEWATMQEQINTGHRYYLNKRPVVQLAKNGAVVNKWSGIRVAARSVGVDWKNIWDCCNGKQKTSCGFIWQYEIEPYPTAVTRARFGENPWNT